MKMSWKKEYRDSTHFCFLFSTLAIILIVIFALCGFGFRNLFATKTTDNNTTNIETQDEESHVPEALDAMEAVEEDDLIDLVEQSKVSEDDFPKKTGILSEEESASPDYTYGEASNLYLVNPAVQNESHYLSEEPEFEDEEITSVEEMKQSLVISESKENIDVVSWEYETERSIR